MPTAAPSKPAASTLEERTFESFGGASLDAEKHVIRDVKLIGFESLNGRSYPAPTLKKAVSLYENAKVNVDHPAGNPTSPRSVADRIGLIRNARYVEGRGIVGDFHFNPKHKLAEQVSWDAANQPEAVGFSHNATLRLAAKPVAGKQVVEEIVRVRSVDLVADPATTRSLYESQGDGEPAADDSADSEPSLTGRTRDLKDLEDAAFAYVAPGGKKDSAGRTTPRSLRLWPLTSADRVRTALASIPKSSLDPESKDKALKRARSAASRFKITTASKEGHDMDLSTITLEELNASRPDLIEAARKEVAASDELEELRAKLKATEAQLAAHDRQTKVHQELTAAKLDPANKSHVSEVFMKQLLATESVEDRKTLIEDRAALVNVKPATEGAAAKGQKPTSAARTTTDATESLSAEDWAKRLKSRR